MTELEWRNIGQTPANMIRFLTGEGDPASVRSKVSDRKLRLFAVACTRRLRHLLVDQRSLAAVVAAEAYADGQHDEPAMKWVRQVALTICSAEDRQRTMPDENRHAAKMAVDCCSEHASSAARMIAEGYKKTLLNQRWQQRDILHCIVGNPFNPVTLPTTPVAMCSCPTYGKDGWVLPPEERQCERCGGIGFTGGDCLWLTPDVVQIALSAYMDRADNGILDSESLSILADALIDAGCPEEQEVPCPSCREYHTDPGNPFGVGPGYRPERDPASGRHEGGWSNCKSCNGGGSQYLRPGFVRTANPILAHLRRGGPHCRGCWVLDQILGKE